jgi:hypothetical protein
MKISTLLGYLIIILGFYIIAWSVALAHSQGMYEWFDIFSPRA